MVVQNLIKTTRLQEPTATANGALLPPSADPRYASEREKFLKLTAARNELEVELREISAKLHSHLTDDEGDDAEKLLAGKSLSSKDFAALSARVSSLRHEIAVYGRAICIQRTMIRDLMDELSYKASALIADEHRAAALAVANALEQLREAQEREKACHQRLREAGYGSSLPYMGAQLKFTHGSPLMERIKSNREYAE